MAIVRRMAVSREDAEDIAQECLALALSRREELESHPNLNAWLIRAAKYLAIDRLRRARVEGKNAPAVAAHYRWVEANAAHRELAPWAWVTEELLRSAVAELPEADQKVVQLRLARKTFAEIGVALGCSTATAYRRFQRILKALEEWLRKRVEELKAAGRADPSSEPPR